MISIPSPLLKLERDKIIKKLKRAKIRYAFNLKKLRSLRVASKVLVVIFGIAFVFSAHYSLAYYNVSTLDLIYGKSVFIEMRNFEEERDAAIVIQESNDVFYDAAIQKPGSVSYIVDGSSFISVPIPPLMKQIPQYAVQRTTLVPITAYSSTLDQTDASPFITASGSRVRDGIIAANFLPIGTKVKIPELYGDKVFVIEDRMNQRYWHRMDIWMPTRSEALGFGLKMAYVDIVQEI